MSISYKSIDIFFIWYRKILTERCFYDKIICLDDKTRNPNHLALRDEALSKDKDIQMENRTSTKVLLGSPEYHQLTSPIGDGPLFLTMNLNTRCSLCCIKCALSRLEREVGEPLTTNERTQIISNASRSGIRTLVVIGNGEPTENFNTMKEVILTAHECGMSTILFTTANRMDEAQARFYASHNVSLFLSIDSLGPAMYRWLTGRGDLANVLENIRGLRRIYRETEIERVGTKHITRLGVNTTVSIQNINELETIRDFCGEDMLFVANPPMRRGRLGSQRAWSLLVETDGVDRYEELSLAAKRFSETGGHSSLTEGVCGYFSRGVSVDTDGEFISCGYARETGGRYGNARDAKPEDFTSRNAHVRAAFSRFCQITGKRPSCPVRDKDLNTFVSLL